jgi:hypothetical protein
VVTTAPRTLTGLVVGDDPAAWAALGLPVVGDRCTVGGVRVHLVGADGPRGILGWELDPPLDADVDGLPTADDVAADTDATTVASASGHGYAVAAVDHLVVATPDLDRTTAALTGVLGDPRRTVDAARGDAGTRYRFWLLGTCVLEVIGPAIADGDGPARFVGLAFTAPHLDVFADVISDRRPAVQPGRTIATFRTREHDVSVPLAVLTPRPPR